MRSSNHGSEVHPRYTRDTNSQIRVHESDNVDYQPKQASQRKQRIFSLRYQSHLRPKPCFRSYLTSLFMNSTRHPSSPGSLTIPCPRRCRQSTAPANALQAAVQALADPSHRHPTQCTLHLMHLIQDPVPPLTTPPPLTHHLPTAPHHPQAPSAKVPQQPPAPAQPP